MILRFRAGRIIQTNIYIAFVMQNKEAVKEEDKKSSPVN
jgi:hypothetical protein